MSTGYPGYNSIWGKDAASIAEVLKQNGYNTAAWGKWHNTPDWETNQTGPFDRWPTGLGFEYFYGFMGGETSQYEPQMFRVQELYENHLSLDDQVFSNLLILLDASTTRKNGSAM